MAGIKSLLDDDQRRQLELDVETLANDGYDEPALRDYVQGFKEGYTNKSPIGLAGKVAQGALLGYGDELKGVVRSTFTGKSRLYETARGRGQLARAGTDSPNVSLGLEVAGSIAPSILTGIGTVGALGRAASWYGNVGRGAVAGAVEGGTYASGNETGGLAERGAAAIPGAIVGGALGGAVVPVASAVLGTARRAGAAMFPGAAESHAQRALRTAIEESGANPTTVGARMGQAAADGTPMNLAEGIGQQGVDLLEAAAQAPGPGRAAIVQQIGERQMAQPERLANALRRTSGVTEGSLDTALAARQARGEAARPNYAALGGVDLPDDIAGNFRAFLSTPAGRSAYRRAAEFSQQAALRGEPFGNLPSLRQIMDGARLTAGEADVILQGLEATAERKMTAGLTPGARVDTKESINYSKTAEWLRNAMVKRVPEFEKARSEWAGPTQFIESIREGEKALSWDLDTFKTKWRKANTAQQQGMSIGFINSLKSDMEQFAAGPTADASRNLAKRHAVRDKLRLTVGEQADDLLRAIDGEAVTSKTANQVLGNSATPRRLAAKEALDEEPMQGLPTSAGGVVSRIVGYLDQMAQRRTREAIARLGLTTNPEEAAQLVQQILSAPPARHRGTIPGAMLGGPAGAFAGAVTADQ
jgi:hypothetical protein